MMRALLLLILPMLQGIIARNQSKPSSTIANDTFDFAASSPESIRIKRVIDRVQDCIKHNPYYRDGSIYHFPDDAEEHYRDILNTTVIFRQIVMHTWSDYSGPWIENFYIKNFVDKPLSFFNGLIPLFIQWTDLHCSEWIEPKNVSAPTRETLRNALKKVLRKDVLYVTVDQDDQGIFEPLANEFPNILSLSAGGFGHIPIPLIKGELPYHDPPNSTSEYQWTVGFFGTRDRHGRATMLQQLEHSFRQNHITYHFGKSANWKVNILKSKFNLAPRGFGRTSFRLAEIVQSGRVPVYLYDDYEWLPYQGTFEGFDKYGLVGHINDAQKTMNMIKNMGDDQYNKLIEHIKRIRHLYTYNGAIEQIKLFLTDPFGDGGGYLRCSANQPKKDHRLRRA